MKTINTYEIYRHAWSNLLALWSTETERNERFIKEHGRENSIAKARIEKYSSQMDELHEAMLQIEREMSAAATA